MATLTARLEQPVQIVPDRRADNLRTTRPYVPGWVVRGAFAAAWIRRYGPPATGDRATFLDIFEGEVRYGPLFAHGGLHGLSELVHKYPTDTCQSTVDLAFESGPAESAVRHEQCADCGAPLEPARGLRTAPATRRHTSTQIHDRGVAAAEKLYSQDAIRAAQTMHGELIGDEVYLEELVDLSPVHLGGRATTHGRVTCTLADSADEWIPAIRDDGLLVLRLASAAVFVDDEGHPTNQPSSAELTAELGLRARVVHEWTRWEHIGGWHAASGLPKPVEIAVEGGSTYLIKTDGEPDPGALAALRRRGVGLRRHEGFGHLQPALDPGVRRQLQWLSESRKDYDAAFAYAIGDVAEPVVTTQRGTRRHTAWQALRGLPRTDVLLCLREMEPPTEELAS